MITTCPPGILYGLELSDTGMNDTNPTQRLHGRSLRNELLVLRNALLVLVCLGNVAACYGAEQIVILGLFKNKVIAEIDGKRRVLTVDAESPDGVKLIKANSAEAFIEINGERNRYTLGSHIASSFRGPEPGASVQIWPDTQGMYLVAGNINGFAVRFLVDTGATLIAMNRNEAKRMGIDYKLDGIEGATATASGTAKAYYLKLDRVRVGDITLRDVRAAVIDGDYPLEVLLGNSFLSRLDLQRDGVMMELRQQN